MNVNKKVVMAAVALAACPVFAKSASPDIDALVSKMTLKEKVGQLLQMAYTGNNTNRHAQLDAAIERGEISSLIWGCGLKRRNELQHIAVEKTRLGIPLIFAMDFIHGTKLIFPNAPALAGSFEPELFEKAQTVAAAEARVGGVEWAFAPMCDTARDPRWGRVQETCGEDPYLNALCCAAQVRGFQGADPSAPDRVLACPKHYVAYSSVTGGRDYNDSEITEWQLRNLHLVPFRAAIEGAKAATVMSSFNTVDGMPAVASQHVLDEVLRGEWGFRGFVVSDWAAVNQIVNWGVARDKREAAVMALTAGNDMDMESTCFSGNLEAAVKAGEVKMSTVDTAVKRVLGMKKAAGLFERPYADEKNEWKKWAEMRKTNAPLARECVRKSVVLMKNDKATLPFDAAKLKRVALIGPYADSKIEMLGAWRGWGDVDSVVTVAAGLKEALPNAKIEVVSGCAVNEKPATKTLQDGSIVLDPEAAKSSKGLDAAGAVAAATKADAVIVTIGEPCGMTGENQSRGTLAATGRQMDLFNAVVATGKPVVALVFAGRPLVLDEVYEKAAAVLYCWQPGSEAGNGIADLLLGKESPSARLTMSFPWSVGEVPCFYNRPSTGRPTQGEYKDLPRRRSRFPFGFGLTYSKFEYSKPVVKGDVVTATVKNVGQREATETAQLYVHQKACREGWRPVRELRGFRRLRLAPGQSAEVAFNLTDETLGYTRRDGKKACDKGEYTLWIAPDSNAGGQGVGYVRR